MKYPGKKVHRKEGKDRERLFTEIICDQCSNTQYERRSGRIQKVLEAPCRPCERESIRQQNEARREASRHQRECDKALIDAHRSIQKLITKRDKRKKHGLSTGETQRTYKIWVGMMSRCYKQNNAAFDQYGGKGVQVCQRWHDPALFIQDMGLAPDGYSIERNDTHGNYEPLNCRWIPKSEQSANRRICYRNRKVQDPKEFQRRKAALIRSNAIDVDSIPYGYKNGLGWWREFGLYENPYVYGPMPWKRSSLRYRRAEAIERGWHVPNKDR